MVGEGSNIIGDGWGHVPLPRKCSLLGPLLGLTKIRLSLNICREQPPTPFNRLQNWSTPIHVLIFATKRSNVAHDVFNRVSEMIEELTCGFKIEFESKRRKKNRGR